ncbi:MAG: two-component sensor histidine kinase [Polyangiaceae bacterium]|nr:two-component sensor histidine kinase [Polyangiaceae bacterium]
MPLPLGVPDPPGSGQLLRRMTWLAAARLLLLLLLLVLVSWLYLGGVGSTTLQAALLALAISFGASAVYAALLRQRKNTRRLNDVQLVFDQLSWSVFVYLTGGATSGAVSFYGLTCVMGAMLSGARGALVACLTGGSFYAAVSVGLHYGWLPTPPDQPAAVYALSRAELTYHIAITWLVLIVVTLLAGYLAERLRKAGGQLLKAEQRAQRAEQMAALGQLAAGLAHEIRNPLGSIAGSIQLLKMNPALSDDDRKLCEIVHRETARLNELVTDMVDLSRSRTPTRTEIDVAAVAREVVSLASGSGRASSDVHLEYEGVTSATILADGAQLRQLVWNLVRNGVQASRAGDVVQVSIHVQQGRVLLAVSDQGDGIHEAEKARIFDAFFTTRSKGTGVGLAVVKSIADQHGFTIDVLSEHGMGATFAVDLGESR